MNDNATTLASDSDAFNDDVFSEVVECGHLQDFLDIFVG